MSDYTKGPWGYRVDRNVFYGRIVTPAGNIIIKTGGLDENVYRLISAAPELLEALKGVTEKYCGLVNSGDTGFWNPEEEKEVIAARSAISKAEGK